MAAVISFKPVLSELQLIRFTQDLMSINSVYMDTTVKPLWMCLKNTCTPQ